MDLRYLEEDRFALWLQNTTKWMQVKLLLEAGADPNIRDEEGEWDTPHFLASESAMTTHSWCEH